MNTTTLQLPIQITASALAEIKDLQLKNLTTKALRIGVKGGGCAGFSYILEFDTPTNNDTLYTIENTEIIIDKSQEIYLINTEIDFKNGLENRGFIYNNPNAQSTCGCGTSFSA